MILTEDIQSIRDRMPEPTRWKFCEYRAKVKEHYQGLGWNYEFPTHLIEDRNKLIVFRRMKVRYDGCSFWAWVCMADNRIYY